MGGEERSETVFIKEGGCGGIAHLTEREKWEATKAEWLRIAKVANQDEGLSLTQMKPTNLKSLVSNLPFCKSKQRQGRKKHKSSSSHSDQNVNPLEKNTLRMQEEDKTHEKDEFDPTLSEDPKLLERTEGWPSNENPNADESSSVRLMNWENVKEAMNKLTKLKSKEEELNKKLLTSFSTELKLKDELLSVREEMLAFMNQGRD